MGTGRKKDGTFACRSTWVRVKRQVVQYLQSQFGPMWGTSFLKLETAKQLNKNVQYWWSFSYEGEAGQWPSWFGIREHISSRSCMLNIERGLWDVVSDRYFQKVVEWNSWYCSQSTNPPLNISQCNLCSKWISGWCVVQGVVANKKKWMYFLTGLVVEAEYSRTVTYQIESEE